MTRRKVISILCLIAAVILGITAAYFGVKIYRYYNELDTQTAAFDELAASVDIVRVEDDEDKEVDNDTQDKADTDELLLEKYRELSEQNPDMVGWISIDDTVVNYPVMQTPDNANYYLNHNFENEISTLGTPYIQENCDITASDNLIIYGHHIRGGRMFAALDQYTDESFYKEHKIIHFDTLNELGDYEIIAVFKTTLYEDDVLPYYDFVNAENESAFDGYVGSVKSASLYDTGVDASYGDRLITLSTCEYSTENGRLVVVAKRITEE
jgi:sortase B